MKNLFFLCLLLFISNFVRSQQYDKNIVDSIINEGFLLYKLESASWKATDITLKSEKEILKDVKGYLSYLKKDSICTIFWNKDSIPKILLTLNFDSTFNTKKVVISNTIRIPNESEGKLIKIREKALDYINNDHMGFFRVYPKSSLNLIPIPYANRDLVIIMTGTKESGLVPFGNDYVIYFNKAGELVNRNNIHNSYVPMPTVGPSNMPILQAIHTHFNSDFISSTDICNILLYKKKIKWTHLVVTGPKFTSIWDVKKGNLSIMTNSEYLKYRNK